MSMLNIDEAWENFCDGDYDIKPLIDKQLLLQARKRLKFSDLYYQLKQRFHI